LFAAHCQLQQSNWVVLLAAFWLPLAVKTDYVYV
jgi:hypothetical protein